MSDPVETSDSVLAAIGEVALAAGEASLIAAYPVLGWPVIGSIFLFIASKLEIEVVRALQNYSAIVIINISNEAQAADAKSAADKLKAASSDPSSTPDQIQKAKDDFKRAYASLIGFSVSTPFT